MEYFDQCVGEKAQPFPVHIGYTEKESSALCQDIPGWCATSQIQTEHRLTSRAENNVCIKHIKTHPI